MKKILPALLKNIEDAPIRYSSWILSLLGIISARIMVENWLDGFSQRSASFFVFEFSHTFFFFLFSYLLLLPILQYFTQTSLKKNATVLLFGFLIILTPPLIDAWISNGKGLWSFYKFDGLGGLWHRFLTFFGDKPDIGITYGVRVEVFLVTLLVGWYTFLKTARLTRSLAASVFTYSLLFILGTFPSWITLLLLGFQVGFTTVSGVDVAQIFLSPPLLFSRLNLDVISSLNIKMSLVYALLLIPLIITELWYYFPKIFFALVRNLRFPQMIYHGGLVCVGAGMATLFTQATLTPTFFSILAFLVIIIAVECSWLASTIVNDIFDEKTDILTNKHRPLPQKAISHTTYISIGATFFFASLLLSLIVHPSIALLLLMYQALAWIYSAWPLRLKRFPIIATFLSSIACLLVLFSGFILVSPDGSIHRIPHQFIILLLATLTLSLPLKDFKDIEGDKAESVYTIPVIFGEYWGKIIIGSGIFLSYLFSVILLHEWHLFWWAILFGGASFWILFMSYSKEKGWFRFHYLPGWMLANILLYGLVIVYYL